MGLFRRRRRDDARKWKCADCHEEGIGDPLEHVCPKDTPQPGSIAWSGARRAPHNPHQQLIPAGDHRTATELIEAAGGNVPALVQAVTTIAGRFEQFVGNIHELNKGLQEFKRDIVVPFREELKHLRYTTGDRLNHASADLEKYVAKLDQVLWAALRAQGMSDDAIRSFRTENGMEPETPRGFELEMHLNEMEELRQAVRTLSAQNARLLAQLDTRHTFNPGENGWVWHQDCGCAQCHAETQRMVAMQKEASRG
jgi:hypothetical protein